MKILIVLLCVISTVACTERVPAETDASAAGEPEFFKVDRAATGPLTLGELQIDIPDEIDKMLDAGKRSCFFEAVTRRANEAGDPAEIEPDAFPYWGGEVDQNEWRQHSKYMQRTLLAQAIISWAMIDC